MQRLAASPALHPPPKSEFYIGEDSRLKAVEDVDVFSRHPSPRALGGAADAASKFPGGRTTAGYPYLLQRLSDHVYSVCAYCRDPSLGARFVFKKIKGFKRAVWVPPPNCGLGGANAPAGAAVVDTLHLHMVDKSNGRSRLTGEALCRSVSSETTHLFINSFKDAPALADAISRCGALQVVTIFESNVSQAVVEALAAKGASLRGLLIDKCTPDGLGTGDGCWASLFAASPGLLWCTLNMSVGWPFGAHSWETLPTSLRALSVTQPMYGVGAAQPAEVEALATAAKRLPALKWLKIGNADPGL